MKAANTKLSRALVDATCFGMIGTIHHECPHNALAADLGPLGEASDALTAMCGGP